MDTLGLRIKKERKRLGFTQVAFAKIGGVEPNAQGHYESGYRSPKADYLQKLSDAGVDVAYLFSSTPLALSESKQVEPDTTHPSLQRQPSSMEDAQSTAVHVSSLLSALHTSLSDTTDVIVGVASCFSLPNTGPREQNFERQVTAFREDARRFINQASFRIKCSTLDS
ncbi:helix-turn-helix domain-containing protein [Pseudomonas sp. NPDC088368]|uniref:helix-turn-helix domain-containing protein n=1 Tax=Pseudomonas sp. NPDC088368 TaxID=3364453 RepID=UPI0038231A95